MSYQDWLKKYYPIEALALASASDLACVDHCLNKWEGALLENIDGNYDNWTVIFDEDSEIFEFNDGTCALCRKYSNNCMSDEGVKCPIIRMQGLPCDNDGFEDTEDATYYAAECDPSPMINLLLSTKEFLLKEQPPCK